MKRHISFFIVVLLVFLCSCRASDNSDSDNNPQDQSALSSSDALVCFPAELTIEQKTKKATHIMFAECLSAELHGDRAVFIFLPSYQFKGEAVSKMPSQQIVVYGDAEDYSFTSTYAPYNAYLLYLEYDEKTGEYKDMLVNDTITPLIDIYDYYDPRTEQILEYNKSSVEQIQAAIARSEK